ncbi:MAG: DUF1127 domain-containing protein [Marinobacter sp.]|uniref:DUF1127 domain-containing protein n=1 Tax=Marinobacter sp. TaxID=50741 RepID=UPI0034A0A331
MIKIIKAKQQVWQTRITSRNQLRQMDKRLLKDIGITPLDALNEFRKPFWRA